MFAILLATITYQLGDINIRAADSHASGVISYPYLYRNEAASDRVLCTCARASAGGKVKISVSTKYSGTSMRFCKETNQYDLSLRNLSSV
jgi:hypothetical protein